MKMINLRRRLEVLEQHLTSEPILLLMPGGRIETLPGQRLRAQSAWTRRPWRPDAGDGTGRPKPQFYRAGRCPHDRPRAGAVERTGRGGSKEGKPGMRNLARRLQKLEGRSPTPWCRTPMRGSGSGRTNWTAA
jgi:hypothetical protein